MRKHGLFAVTATLASLAAAPAFAATQRVPQDHATIQAAVDAAAAGDTILVSKGVYIEQVVVTGKNGLQFVGKGAIWDGGDDGTQLLATADDLLVQGFTFRHGEVQVGVFGEGATVTKCKSTGAAMHFVLVQANGGGAADNTVVEKCQVQDSGGPALKIYSDNTHVMKCKFEAMNVHAVLVSGDNAVVERCSVRGANVHGLVVEGNNARIERNVVNRARIKSILVFGGDPDILSNKIVRGGAVSGIEHAHAIRAPSSSDPGPFLSGGLIEGNKISYVKGSGIRSSFGTTVNILGNKIKGGGSFGVACSTHEGRIEGNAIQKLSAIGVLVLANDADVRGNTVKKSGHGCDSAFWIEGDRNALGDNAVKDFGGDGFWVDGDDNTLTGNTATKCTEDGFDVNAGNDNSLSGCTARACSGEGLDNSGTNTVVNSSTFLGNFIDLVNDGTFATLNATFDTGGDSEPGQIECDDDARFGFETRSIEGVSRTIFDRRVGYRDPDFERDLDVITQP